MFEERKHLHVRRTLSFAVFGLSLGPVLHPWYGFVARTAARLVPATGFKQTMAMLAIDQAFMPPLLNVYFWLSTPLVEGKSLEEAKQTLASNFYPTLIANYQVWPAVMFLNFRFVPPQLRLLTVNVVSLVWNTYFSWYGHRAAAIAELEKASRS